MPSHINFSIPPTTPGDRYDYPHFTNEETEVQRGYCLAQGHTANKQWSQDLNPGSLAPELHSVASARQQAQAEGARAQELDVGSNLALPFAGCVNLDKEQPSLQTASSFREQG